MDTVLRGMGRRRPRNACSVHDPYSYSLSAHLVLIIFKNAPIEFNRVTMCALPVYASVTVITGHEKAKNSSNEVKRCPHVLSNLVHHKFGIGR